MNPLCTKNRFTAGLLQKSLRPTLLALGLIFGVLLQKTQAQGQCTLICNSDLEISLFDSTDLVLTPEMVLVDLYENCPFGDFEVLIFDNNGNLIGNAVNGSHIGIDLTVRVTNRNNGAFCTSALRVVDEAPPVIVCSDVYVHCNDSILPRHIGWPVVTDNVTEMHASDLTYNDVFNDLECFTMQGDSMITAQVDRIWQGIDGSGNVATKVQHIYYVRRTLAFVQFPKNRDGVTLPTLRCNRDNPNDLKLTGVPTVDGRTLMGPNNCEFLVTYNDQTTVNCVGEKRIQRSWRVKDICLDSAITVVQILKVRDIQAPTLTCPDTMLFNTNPFSCHATVTLQDAIAVDSCSTPMISITWQFGRGKGPFYNVPVGLHKVTYVATDNCGNYVSCTATVVVRDREQPTPVCDVTKEISLQSNGTAIAYAASFDDGSNDNCGIDRFEVSRGGLPFADKAIFDCSDIGKTVQVQLRVYDKAGYHNECSVNVKVVDRIVPVITCPTEVTLDCQADIMNLELTGSPVVSDNCAVKEVSFSDSRQVNACGIGTILRTWLVEDASGNLASGTQSIQLRDITPISVTFPNNYISYDCGASVEPSVTGLPVITGADCENIEYSYTDQVFPTSLPACQKVLRHWTVADWCTYRQGSGSTDGVWTATQIIRVIDTIAPKLQMLPDLTVGTKNDGCEAEVKIAPIAANDCSPNIVITNDSPFALQKGADVSGTYPKGRHVITFTAEDGCGNVSTGKMTILVVDDKPPTPICITGIAIPLNSDGEARITPAMIMTASFDNCSPKEKLTVKVEPNYFTCEQIGEQNLTITVTDEAGNKGICVSKIDVQDPLSVCSPLITKANIGGKIETMGGTPAVQVLVGLSGGLPMGRQTHTDGTYRFENLPKGQNYTIKPTYDGDVAAGVSTLDLVLIQKHILNVSILTSPYQWIAADANKSGTISTLDVVALRKVVLRVATTLPNNTSWRFVDAQYEFSGDITPLTAPFPEAVSISNLNANRLNCHFVAIKIGDVNGSARLNTLGGDIEERSIMPPLEFVAEAQDLKAGKEYAVAMKAANFSEINGFQFTLNFDNNVLEYLDFQPGTLQEFDDRNLGLLPSHRSALTVSWHAMRPVTKSKNETLFTFRFLAKADGKLSEVLRINSNLTTAEAYASPTQDATEILEMKLTFMEGTDSDFDMQHNRPNPFRDETKIPFYLSKATDMTLTISDLYGNQITALRQMFSQGHHEWTINSDDLADKTGVFIYRLSGEGIPARTAKMIRMDD